MLGVQKRYGREGAGYGSVDRWQWGVKEANWLK